MDQRKLQYAMWLVVLLRLLVPVQLLSYAETETGELSYLLEVRQEDEVLWFATAGTTPTGWNALFLTKVGEQDYLLDVESKESLNKLSYCYSLFSFNENGGRRICGRRHF